MKKTKKTPAELWRAHRSAKGAAGKVPMVGAAKTCEGGRTQLGAQREQAGPTVTQKLAAREQKKPFRAWPFLTKSRAHTMLGAMLPWQHTVPS